MLAIAAASLIGLFTIQEALSGFANSTVWLIVAAFLFARGFVQTRLGERIAYHIVRRFGGSALRLGYSIVLADLAMAPMTPSNTARAGGILFPITLSVARAFGSEPGPTASLIGAFLMMTLYQGDLVVSAMFLTATAPNPLVAELARQGSGLEAVVDDVGVRRVGAGHRGAAGRAATSSTGCVRRRCATRRPRRRWPPSGCAAMGPISARERLMLAIFAMVLLLWLSAEWHGASPTAVACLGLALLLVTRVLDWQDVLARRARGMR